MSLFIISFSIFFGIKKFVSNDSCLSREKIYNIIISNEKTRNSQADTIIKYLKYNSIVKDSAILYFRQASVDDSLAISKGKEIEKTYKKEIKKQKSGKTIWMIVSSGLATILLLIAIK